MSDKQFPAGVFHVEHHPGLSAIFRRPADQKYTRFGVWNPQEVAPQPALPEADPSGIGFSEPEHQLAFVAKSSAGPFQKNPELPNGAAGDVIGGEFLRSQLFKACVSHLDLGQEELLDYFLEEGTFLPIGVDEGRGQAGKGQLDRERREATARAQVDELPDGERHGPHRKERFGEVALENRFRLANGGQIDLPVPSREELEVAADGFRGRGRDGEIFAGEASGDLLRG
jgi:hypothetical protein